MPKSRKILMPVYDIQLPRYDLSLISKKTLGLLYLTPGGIHQKSHLEKF